MSPELIGLYDLNGKVVVVVDIFRATSCMTAALAHGVKSITPVATLEEAKALQEKGYVVAAERGGSTVEGFDLSNSPFNYTEDQQAGKKLGMTTTNGTLAISKSKDADEIIIGSFLNLSATIKYLKSTGKDVLVHCAGWKGKLCLEDTLYAGAVVELLKDTHETDCDAPLMAQSLYNESKNDLLGTLKNAAHALRLKGLGIQKDIAFCVTTDVYDVIPVLRGSALVRL